MFGRKGKQLPTFGKKVAKAGISFLKNAGRAGIVASGAASLINPRYSLPMLMAGVGAKEIAQGLEKRV